MDLESIRKEYVQGGLNECHAPEDPFVLFGRWMQEALDAGVNEPTAMVVATAAPDGMPSARTVLLKGIGDGKFVFYTNYESRKGRQLEGNPRVALLFPWYALERQVHIEGEVVKLSPEASDAYFDSRPVESRIGAIVSPQSRVIRGRTGLLRDFLSLRERVEAWGAGEALEGASGLGEASRSVGASGEVSGSGSGRASGDVCSGVRDCASEGLAATSGEGLRPLLVRPAHWGGYAVTPQRIEFWQGRASRLHDRILYTLQSDGRWIRQRLAP